MVQTPWWQRVIAIALLPVLLPVAAIAGLFSKPTKRTIDEVESYLSNFIEIRGQPFGWDDFTSVDIDDPELDAIRTRAANIKLPVDLEGEAELRQLLTDTQRLQEERRS